MDNHCTNCPYNAKLLHSKMPFGCFLFGCDGEVDNRSNEAKEKSKKYVQNEWIKTHPNWKNTPHIKWWYIEDNEKNFEKFLKMYPDAEHAPNDSWKDMYDIVILN